MRTLVYIFISLLTLASCTKEVNIDIPGYEEQLVIDGSIETGMPPLVLLSRSKDFYSPTNLASFLSGFVSGATVTVSDGTTSVVLEEICTDNLPPGSEAIAAGIFGIPQSELANYHLCAYSSFNTDIWGQVGKTYNLTVTFEGKTYTSSTSILQPGTLDSLYWKKDGDLTEYGYSWATLTDPASQYDAYKWEVRRINKDINGDPIDPVFTETFSPVFDDDFFDGLTFDFFYENPTVWEDQSVPDQYKGYYKIGDSVVVKLSKMDRYVFDFMEKKYIQLSTAGNPFATPTNIPSNIKGGALGVWAGYSPSYDTLICAP
jgi:hypothetical protein